MFKVMVIDDEPLTREFLKIHIPLLHDQWIVVAEAMDGSEAWDILQNQQVDLIITDIKMPIMDGLELCKQIHEYMPRQKMIILSGYDEFSMAKKAMQYGISHYLLKPIRKEELVEILQNITLEIENQATEELSVNTIKSNSKDMKKQVVQNYLKSIVSDESLEIKALQPLIVRLNVRLLEHAGLIMIMDLDTEKILEKNVPIRDIPLYKYILHQVVTEIADESSSGTVFFDEFHNTVVLIVGENEEALLQKSKNLHDKAAAFIQLNTGITVTSALGSLENNMDQIHYSYQMARKIIQVRLFSNGDTLYTYNEHTTELNSVQELENSLASIQSGLLDHNEILYSVSVIRVVQLICDFSPVNVLKMGNHLIESLAQLRQLDWIVQAEHVEYSLNKLKAYVIEHRDHLSKTKTIILFQEITKHFLKRALPNLAHLNDQDIVTKTKEFIYAHYSEPLSLEHIAEHIGVSLGYLSSLFHKKANESYIKFLTRVRMEQAAKLLTSTPTKKVFDVAAEVGYLSVKHFSHVFKKHFGIPPGEFQEKHAGI